MNSESEAHSGGSHIKGTMLNNRVKLPPAVKNFDDWKSPASFAKLKQFPLPAKKRNDKGLWKKNSVLNALTDPANHLHVFKIAGVTGRFGATISFGEDDGVPKIELTTADWEEL